MKSAAVQVQRSSARNLSVHQLLRRAQLRMAYTSLLVVGLVLTTGTALMMKVSTQRNLELQARSVAYSIEAAVMFQDASATKALLNDMLEEEPVSNAWVVLDSGISKLDPHQPFARYTRGGDRAHWETKLMSVWPMYASTQIVAHDKVIGEVKLQADASLILELSGWLLSAVAVGMALTGVAVARASRKLADRLVAPLQALAAHTLAVRVHRSLERRAPRSDIRELDQLSNDFDALLDEIKGHQFELLRRHDELRSAHELLSIRVREDVLTGAATRAHFEECLDQAVRNAEQSSSRFALLFIDADRFKAINDEHGHDAGDLVLISMAERLKGAVRESDLVGRLGGDEFVVLVRSLREPGDAQRLAAQLSHALSAPLVLPNGITANPGASIGTAVYPDDARTASGLMKAADKAMYQNKEAARLNANVRQLSGSRTDTETSRSSN